MAQVIGTSAESIDVSVSDATFDKATLFIGTGGDIKVDMVGAGTAVIFKNVASGFPFPYEVTKVYTTDTTATDILRIT